MTRQQVQTQIANYRESAAQYRAQGDVDAAAFLDGRVYSMQAVLAAKGQ